MVMKIMVIYRFTCFYCVSPFLSETRDVQDSWGRVICLGCYNQPADESYDDYDFGAEADARYVMYTATLLGVA